MQLLKLILSIVDFYKLKKSDMMKINEYPQYMLFKFTKLLNFNREKFQKQYTGKRAVNSTLINRAYYSSYSYALLWLEEIKNFKLKQKWEYAADGEEYVSEHQQVRNALRDFNKMKSSRKLKNLHDLRKKADYNLFNPLTKKDLDKSIEYMNDIFKELKFP